MLASRPFQTPRRRIMSDATESGQSSMALHDDVRRVEYLFPIEPAVEDTK